MSSLSAMDLTDSLTDGRFGPDFTCIASKYLLRLAVLACFGVRSPHILGHVHPVEVCRLLPLICTISSA